MTALARIIHDDSAAIANSLLRHACMLVSRHAGERARRSGPSTYCFKYASGPRGSTRKTLPPHRLGGVHKPETHWALTNSRPFTSGSRHCRLTVSPARTNVALFIHRAVRLIILRAVDLATRLRDFATNRHE